MNYECPTGNPTEDRGITRWGYSDLSSVRVGRCTSLPLVFRWFGLSVTSATPQSDCERGEALTAHHRRIGMGREVMKHNGAKAYVCSKVLLHLGRNAENFEGRGKGSLRAESFILLSNECGKFQQRVVPSHKRGNEQSRSVSNKCCCFPCQESIYDLVKALLIDVQIIFRHSLRRELLFNKRLCCILQPVTLPGILQESDESR
jgi:hypothetical protein